MSQIDIEILEKGEETQLAYRRSGGRGPALIWLCGFRSDMGGTKAEHLHAWAWERGQAFIRFDYRGHGSSSGDFELLGIGDWLADTLAILDRAAPDGPVVLVGSSMGGWLALLAALARPERVKGLVLIAPAVDFTQRLLEPGLPDAARRDLAASGRWERPSAYGDGPYVITQHLIDSGRAHRILTQPIPIAAPVRILHGQQDPDVPWPLSQELAEALQSPDVRVTFVKAGDHRLSTPADLALLRETVGGLLDQISPSSG
jgi:alpha-beta hydrolase superfamily lysophospholipase